MTVIISNQLPTSQPLPQTKSLYKDLISNLRFNVSSCTSEKLQKDIKCLLKELKISAVQLLQEFNALSVLNAADSTKIKYVLKNLCRQEQLKKTVSSLSERNLKINNDYQSKLNDTCKESSELKEKVDCLSKENTALKNRLEIILQEMGHLKAENNHLSKENKEFFERLVLCDDEF